MNNFLDDPVKLGLSPTYLPPEVDFPTDEEIKDMIVYQHGTKDFDRWFYENYYNHGTQFLYTYERICKEIDL